MKIIYFFILIFFWSSGCKNPISENSLSVKESKEDIFFDLKLGETKFKVEVAVLPKEREKGLMYRDRIGPKEGMLFVFKEGSIQRFWMKNTRIPLDIGYFSTDGILKEIHKGRPNDLTGVASRSRDIKFVLELNEGTFAKLKIPLGSRISLAEVSSILIKRGLRPSQYNLPTSFIDIR